MFQEAFNAYIFNPVHLTYTFTCQITNKKINDICLVDDVSFTFTEQHIRCTQSLDIILINVIIPPVPLTTRRLHHLSINLQLMSDVNIIAEILLLYVRVIILNCICIAHQ